MKRKEKQQRIRFLFDFLGVTKTDIKTDGFNHHFARLQKIIDINRDIDKSQAINNTLPQWKENKLRVILRNEKIKDIKKWQETEDNFSSV